MSELAKYLSEKIDNHQGEFDTLPSEEDLALWLVEMPPIDMVLHCPACGLQHIDAPTPCTAETCESGCACPGDCLAWTNPPHRSHLCHNPACGYIWRPADVPTNGVQAVKTRGKNDSDIDESLHERLKKGTTAVAFLETQNRLRQEERR